MANYCIFNPLIMEKIPYKKEARIGHIVRCSCIILVVINKYNFEDYLFVLNISI